MSTNDQFATASLKALFTWEDWDLYVIRALRELNRKSVIARWNVDGVYDTLLTLSGPAANTVRINGTSWGTDGQGHILDIAAATTRDAVFQNTNAVVYYVSMFYGECPSEIRPSPRTGVMQYIRTREVLGRSASPNSVVDNGNGTLTFVVNSVTEANVTNAGRTIRVFKKIPGQNATTLGIAMEDVVATFDGTNNRITTTGVLGQSGTPSTTASDYVVICLGPTVTRNEDTRVITGACFIGTVTGNGGTPASFSTTDQRLLKTFDDATQVLFTPSTPAQWPDPDPTTVAGALDKIVSMYASASAGQGASLIGNPQLTSVWADATPIPAGTLKAQLESIVAALSDSLPADGSKRISSDQLPNWADATSITAGTVFSQIQGIVSALAGAAGDSKITAAFKSGSPLSLDAGTLFSQLQSILDQVNKTAKIWTFLALAKNWYEPNAISSSADDAMVWNPNDRYWYFFGADGGGNAQGQRSLSGRAGTFSALTVAAGVLQPVCAAARPDGVMIMGGAAGSSTSKIRESSNGTTWNARNTVAGVGADVSSAIWFAGASLFIIGLTNTATTNIETSSNGQTWTQRTAPNSHARGPMATNGTTVVMLSTTSTDKCITSTDGINWTERTLGTTTTWKSVVYMTLSSGDFFVAFRDGGYAFSANGTSWTNITASFGFSLGGNQHPTMGAAAIGSVAMIWGIGDNEVWAGYFVGTTPRFYHVNTVTGDTLAGAASDGQFMVTAESLLYRGFAGGT